MEAALVAVLAPFLAQLLKSGESSVADIGQRAGDEAWELAKRIWTRLSPRIKSKPAAVEAAGDVSHRPDDPRARSALELQIEKLLAAEPSLMTELRTLLDSAGRSGDVNFHGDVRADRGGVVAGRIEGGVRTGWRKRDE
jgi:hypothetical protein